MSRSNEFVLFFTVTLHHIYYLHGFRMDKLLRRIFSMPLMAVALFAFFVVIGYATIFENDFGRLAAQKYIYRTVWFELILFYLSLSLIFNIYRYNLFKLSKIGSLTFHLALLVIVAGAYTTRKIGYEGNMRIREGQASNELLSADTYFQALVHDFNKQYRVDVPVMLDTNVYKRKGDGSPDYSHNYFDHEVDFPGQDNPVKFEFLDFIPNIKDTLIETQSGDAWLELVTVGEQGRDYNYIRSGEVLSTGGIFIGFNDTSAFSLVNILSSDSGLVVLADAAIQYYQMSDSTEGVLSADTLHSLAFGRLYTVEGTRFVLRNYFKHGELQYISDQSGERGPDGLLMKVTQGELTKEILLPGGLGIYPKLIKFTLGDLNYELAWGSRIIELPFSIFLNDFQMERYPGTNNPSSFASEVTVLDHASGQQFDHRIFMNHVLDYGGYRFFQSSYDPDERGTILSVNYDKPGTLITYCGYFLLGLGFVLNLFARNGRFRYLVRKTKELDLKKATLAVLVMVGIMSSGSLMAQPENVIDKEHADQFSRLIVQDFKGRQKPVHTVALEVLRKVYRADNYKGLSATQVFLGIHSNKEEWATEPLIAIPNEQIGKKLNLPEGNNRACVSDFLDMDGNYLLYDDVITAQLKRPADQNKYDKDILKTDERFNVLIGVFSGYYLKIFPMPGDSNNTWYSPFDPAAPFTGEDAEVLGLITMRYFEGIQMGYESGDWSQANIGIQVIREFQRAAAPPEIMPSEQLVNLEIMYNEMNLFKRLNYGHLITGFLMLVVGFISVFRKKDSLKWMLRIGFILVLLMTILHGSGLGMRWYISGHAPWSNGYEAMIFIGFITAVATLVFYRLNVIVLGAGSILTWLMLFVAHMNNMDPDISPLVPVLQSYWLMIHVAVITASYAFLGIAAILALVNFLLFCFVNDQNKLSIRVNAQQITYIIEVAIIVGLFLLTVGTFLGGVWANESWGRYWGWDAKETWALASVVVYALILHFRFIPRMQGMFTMNIAALWGYSSIIMTFYGVNYYLSGLHSYAQGDRIPIEMWVPITVFLLICLCILSYLRYRLFLKPADGKHSD